MSGAFKPSAATSLQSAREARRKNLNAHAPSEPSTATPLQTALSWFPLNDFFSLDLRSLAVFRIGLGIMLLQEWLNRLVDLDAHYTDAGILPRDAIVQTVPISIFMLSGSAWWPALLMSIGCVLAVLLMVGWRTQFITFLSWFLLIGVHGRTFAIMQGGDVVMRMLLFWGMFLPLGACYSLDALREPLREWRPRVLSPGSVAYIVQMCLLYLFAAAWKSAPEWRTDHTAVYLALSLDGFATRLGHWLLNFPTLLKGLTIGTMILEIFGTALLFIPFANGPIRVFVIASFCLFHTGLGLTMELGNFPWICCLAWIALLPAWFWDQLEARLRSSKRAGLVVYYDGDNAWHRTCVEAVRMFLILYESKLVPAQEDETHLERVRRLGPWLVVDADGKERVQYEAFLYLVEVSCLYWPLVRLLRWRPIRQRGEKLVRWLAAQRSKPVSEPVTAAVYPGAQLGGWIQNTIVVFLIVYVIAWNVRTLDSSEHLDSKGEHTRYKDYFPNQMDSFAYVLGLDQSWGLFAPSPGRYDGWYVIPAKLRNGKVVDLYTDGGELTDAKPPLVSATYTNTRTRKLMLNYASPLFQNYRVYYTRYLYNQWNENHKPDEQIEYMHLIYMHKQTEPDRQVTEVTEERKQIYPLESPWLDPITKQPLVRPVYGQAVGEAVGLGARTSPVWPVYGDAFGAAFGPSARTPPVGLQLYTRPVLSEMIKMKEKR